MPAEQPLGAQADPRTFLRDEDFPRWIRELPPLPPRPIPPVTVIALPATEPAGRVAPPATPLPLLVSLPDPSPGTQEPSLQNQRAVVEAGESLPDPTSSIEMTEAPSDPAPRRREAWEAPLLVVLVVGVVMAVVWALLVNGLIGSGL
jgi:hypothetical protein